MHIQQVQKRMLVSLSSIASELDLSEGDYLSIEVKDGGVYLKPVVRIEKNQDYIFTERWQDKIKNSMDDVESEKYSTYDNVEDMLKDLGINEDAKTDTD